MQGALPGRQHILRNGRIKGRRAQKTLDLDSRQAQNSLMLSSIDSVNKKEAEITAENVYSNNSSIVQPILYVGNNHSTQSSASFASHEHGFGLQHWQS